MNEQEKLVFDFLFYCISCYFLSIMQKPYALLFIPLIMVSGKDLFFMLIDKDEEE